LGENKFRDKILFQLNAFAIYVAALNMRFDIVRLEGFAGHILEENTCQILILSQWYLLHARMYEQRQNRHVLSFEDTIIVFHIIRL
jgi:hypothetical protein